MDTFDDDRLNNVEWTTLNACREMLAIALKGVSVPSYERTLQFAQVLFPQVFASSASLIVAGNERSLVREYRQRADAQSKIDERTVTPLELVEKDIERDRILLKNTTGDNDLIQRQLNRLINIREYFKPKSYTENQLIFRDFRTNRSDLPSPKEGDTYREYQLNNGRVLRIRLLHPDKPEHSLGADLIYEIYWDKKQLGRLAVVQYKIWNGNVLYTSQAKNLKSQLERLKNEFCNRGLCEPFRGGAREHAYRLPYCTAFLRPTDKLQNPESRLISRSLHIPICVVANAWKNTEREGDGAKIERKTIRSEALSHKVFEEMFNANMLGSRWLTYDEIKDLYRKHKIFQGDETIVIHAQEF